MNSIGMAATSAFAMVDTNAIVPFKCLFGGCSAREDCSISLSPRLFIELPYRSFK